MAGGERLFTGQADPVSTEALAGANLGQMFTVSANGRFVVGGATWIQAGAFRPWWQVWNKDTATLLREGDITALGGKPTTGWFYFNMADLTAGTTVLTPLSISTGVTYITSGWSAVQPGKLQTFTDGGFSYPFGISPLATAGSIYVDASPPRTTIPSATGFVTGRFYAADVTLDGPANLPQRALVGVSRAAQSRSRW